MMYKTDNRDTFNTFDIQVKEFNPVDEESITSYRIEKAADYALASNAERYLKVDNAGRIAERLPENGIFNKLPIVKVRQN